MTPRRYKAVIYTRRYYGDFRIIRNENRPDAKRIDNANGVRRTFRIIRRPGRVNINIALTRGGGRARHITEKFRGDVTIARPKRRAIARKPA